jgi:hypothetical protein
METAVEKFMKVYTVPSYRPDDRIPGIVRNLSYALTIFPGKAVPAEIVEGFLRNFVQEYKPIERALVRESIKEIKKYTTVSKKTYEKLEKESEELRDIADMAINVCTDSQKIARDYENEAQELRSKLYDAKRKLDEWETSDIAVLRKKLKEQQNPEYVKKVRLARKILRTASKNIEL